MDDDVLPQGTWSSARRHESHSKGSDVATRRWRRTCTVDGQPLILSSANIPEIRKIAGIDVERGSLANLGDDTIALVDDGAPGAKLGSTVTVTDNRGRSDDLRVVALIDPSVDVDSGAQTETKDAIRAPADRRPDISVQEGNAVGRLVLSIFDFLIKAVTGLLLMSVSAWSDSSPCSSQCSARSPASPWAPS